MEKQKQELEGYEGKAETNVAEKAEESEDKLYCPYCGSSQLTANKKGFRTGKALTGAILTGGIGLLAGFWGSNRIRITCLKCGAVMKPGELRTTPLSREEKAAMIKEMNKANKVSKGCLIIFLVISWIMMILLVGYCIG